MSHFTPFWIVAAAADLILLIVIVWLWVVDVRDIGRDNLAVSLGERLFGFLVLFPGAQFWAWMVVG